MISAYASVPAAPTAGRDTYATPSSLIFHPLSFFNPVENVPIRRISSIIIITAEAGNYEITITCLDSRLRGKDREIASSLRSSQ